MGRIHLGVAFAALIGSGIAVAGDKPPVAPPSTGKELAKDKVVVPAERQAEIARIAIKKGDCAGHVAMLSTALSVAGARLTAEERIQANVLLQKCARDSKSWNALIQASVYLLDHAPQKTGAEDLIKAYLALGEEKHAMDMVKVIAKAVPSQLANLTVAASLIACHRNDFALCFERSGKMVDALTKMKPVPAKALFENQIFHAFSAAALGRYDVYDADIKTAEAALAAAHGDASKLAPFKTNVQQARDAKLFVDEDHARELALGTYHLITGGKIKGRDETNGLVTLRLVNQTKKQRSVKATVEVPGVTDVASETIALPPGTEVVRVISPPLKIDFDVAKLRAARNSQIAVHLTDPGTNASLFDKSLPIDVLPRDSLPLRRLVGSDDIRSTYEYAAAWITPNAPEVDAFIKKAKARMPGDHSFTGEQRVTLPQVKALFDELKAHGVSYVEDPSLFDERGLVQRTRLPAEVLASTNAQCLEGTLLYATLLEAIGIQPVLVFIKGHAFIAWKPSKFDKATVPLYFLETTLTGTPATFEQSVEYATNNFAEQVKEKQFELGIAHLIDVAALRQGGYTPQPY